MKRLLMIVLIIVLPKILHGQTIGGLGVGWTAYAGDGDKLDYINNHGFFLTGLVPVRTPVIDVSVKLKLAHFSNKGNHPFLKDYQFVNVSNEFLAGKRLSFRKNINVLPQLGYGIRAESLYTDWDIGYFNIDNFLDYSLWVNRTFEAFDVGLLINYETDLKVIDKGRKSRRRFSLSFIISK
ncbi:MAG: hypothetical protein GXO75_19400 [Calditrichaeota bacterium]|nr:hypothetical protein [Calditrichota bacterium]